MDRYSFNDKESTFSLISKAPSLIKNQLKKNYSNRSNSDISNLKVKKSVHLNGPIFNLKFSSIHPNILASCSQEGYVNIVNTDKEIKVISLSHDFSNNYTFSFIPNSFHSINNTNANNQIYPDFTKIIHDNSIYGLDWSSNDTRIITGGADCLCKITNLHSDHIGISEVVFFGHHKSIKWISQSPFNDSLSASCGRDEVIFIWDLRTKNERYCNNNCKTTKQFSNHIHPIGAFRNMPKNSTLTKKKLSNEANYPNTFTAVNFFTEELVLSAETNNEDIKFWDMRKMLNNELQQLTNEPKYSKKFLEQLNAKKYISGINRHTYIYTKYLQIRDQHFLSSKYNTNNSNLFGFNFPIDTNSTNQNISNGTLDNFARGITTDMISNTKKKEDHTNNSGIKSVKYLDQFNYQNAKEAEREIDINFDVDIMKGKEIEIEEMNQLKNKIKEIKAKKVIKGLTSININRLKRKILVNSISNTQLVYDALFMDEHQPIELKGNVSSSYFVKSVLSHCGQYVLSGSSTPNLCIWDLRLNKETQQRNLSPIKLSGYHKSEINAVDWSRNMSNFIASACDSGLILIWDY